ncbi:MAG: tetratricopeptide repeat protein [Alphaproteobacteria bacterium]
MRALALLLTVVAVPALADALGDMRAANAAYADRNFELAIAAYDSALTQPGLSDRNRTLARYTRGLANGALGRYAAAIADFSLLLAAEPSHAEALNSRGLAYAALGRHGEAIADFTGAIRVRNDHAYAYNNRGASRLALGRFAAALEDFYAALQYSHGAPHLVHANRARLYELRGQTVQALRDWETAARLAPDYAPARAALAEYRALNLAPE